MGFCKASFPIMTSTTIIFLLLSHFYFSLGLVVVPHEVINYDNERCESTCLPESKGIRRSHYSLCEPSSDQCQKSVNITDMTSAMCQAWAHILPFLQSDGVGTQVKQDNAKGSWLPCSVFCQTKSGSWYSPRRELDAYYLSASLPDGTLCYQNNDERYFCQDSLCLPIPENKELINGNSRDFETEPLKLEQEYEFEDELILDDESKVVGKWDYEEIDESLLINPEFLF